MHPDTIVTIGRQFGAGGREIGRRLAEVLGLPFYDRELLALAAKGSGLSEHLFEQHDEKPADSLLYAAWTGPFHPPEPPLGQQVCLAQFQAIRDLAARGGGVVVGRAADFVLAGRPHLVRIFLYAPVEVRVERLRARREGLSPEEARRTIRVADRRRAAFYGYFTDRKWGDPATYDLCLDTSRLPVERAVEVLRAFVEAAG